MDDRNHQLELIFRERLQVVVGISTGFHDSHSSSLLLGVMVTARSHSAWAIATIYRAYKSQGMTAGAAKWSSFTRKWLREQERSAPYGMKRRLFPPSLCHPLHPPHSCINRSSLALCLFFSPPSGWEIHLGNYETAVCHPLQSLACSCICLYPLHFRRCMNI